MYGRRPLVVWTAFWGVIAPLLSAVRPGHGALVLGSPWAIVTLNHLPKYNDSVFLNTACVLSRTGPREKPTKGNIILDCHISRFWQFLNFSDWCSCASQVVHFDFVNTTRLPDWFTKTCRYTFYCTFQALWFLDLRDYQPPTDFWDQHSPIWAVIVGHLITAVTVIPIPIAAACVWSKHKFGCKKARHESDTYKLYSSPNTSSRCPDSR